MLSFLLYAILREYFGKEKKMPDLFTDEYEKAKTKWEEARKTFDHAIDLYDSMNLLLRHAHKELDEAAKEFAVQQAKLVKTGKTKIKVVKKGE